MLVSAGRRLVVHVVGIVEEIAPPTLYTNAATLAALTGMADQAAAFRITTRAGAEQGVAARLEELLTSEGSLPTLLMTRNEFRASLLDHFQVIVICLVAAGVAAVMVGGLSVLTSMSINVIERSREIGIARSIGATQWVVTKMLLTEGVALTALCVGVGVLLSLPLSAGLTILIGNIGPHVRLPFVVSIPAVAGWAVIAAGVTMTSCLVAARRALVLPVREVLAYE